METRFAGLGTFQTPWCLLLASLQKSIFQCAFKESGLSLPVKVLLVTHLQTCVVRIVLGYLRNGMEGSYRQINTAKAVHFGTEQAAAQICADPRQTEM